jgi:hypothetical protein
MSQEGGDDEFPSPTCYGSHPAALVSSGKFPVSACLTFSYIIVDDDGAFELEMASLKFSMYWRVLLCLAACN